MPPTIGLVLVALLTAMTLTGCGEGHADPGPSSAETPRTGTFVGEAQLRGWGHPLYLTRETHPRGGWQLHVYVETGRPWPELTNSDGNPVVPFVATDTRPVLPVAVSCDLDGFTVRTAEPTEQSGVVFAWDVDATTYRFTGSGVDAGTRTRVRNSVPDEQLRRAMPDLFAHRLFTDCRVARQ